MYVFNEFWFSFTIAEYGTITKQSTLKPALHMIQGVGSVYRQIEGINKKCMEYFIENCGRTVVYNFYKR